MHTRLRAGLAAAALVLVLLGASIFGTSRVSAAGGKPPGPHRNTLITENYTSYKWWVKQWSNARLMCQLFIDHDGLPIGSEIYKNCGQDVYIQWINTKPCNSFKEDPKACQGDYLQLVQSAPAQRQVSVALPAPLIWLTLNGCTAIDSTNLCASLPTLVLTGVEPLPNEHIIGIAGTMDGAAFSCDATCPLDLSPTDQNGMALQFWAYSSHGDSSVTFDAQVRVVKGEGADSNSWYVDVISSQWKGTPIGACSEIWNAFPPVGGPPAWLTTPKQSGDLSSGIPFVYLAANLISRGMVDVSTCPDAGFSSDGAVSTCGMDASQPSVDEWQNRFDDQILSAASDSGIPAQLLKNIFSRESQFWPGVFADQIEVGLGHLTDNGADTALLWNSSFYQQYCPLVFADSTCQKGYALLTPSQQALLRGALVRSVDASCSNCSQGLDLTQAGFSISVFAEILKANCEQAGTIVHNATGKTPALASTYEDLWRFTLVNYNAGPGCLILAIRQAQSRGSPLDWKHISADLTPPCQGAIDYVNTISQ